jgi:hypothetical protein
MKIIDIGICIDNVDPKGMGRIRVIDYDDYVSGKENYKKYTPWGEDDAFIALPFLPNNINFIPEVNQTVKVIRYNTEKTTVNQEYIAGPFTTRFDFNGQTYSQQVGPTTFGAGIKDKTDIFTNGQLPADCKDTLAKNTDFSVSGKFGSDVLMTENGIVLRGGKLLTKESANPKERQRMVDYPLSAKKTAKLQLKKFPEKRVLKTEVKPIFSFENAPLKYVVEYNINSLSSPTTVNFFVYKINPGVYGEYFKSNNFTEFTDLPTSLCVLLNNDGTTTTPTFSVDMTTKFDFNDYDVDGKINQICSEIRLTIIKIKEDGFVGLFNADINKKFDSQEELTNIYPFFFRPTPSLRTLTPSNPTELNRKTNLLTGVKISKQIQQSSLVWSASSYSAPTIPKEETIDTLVKDTSSREQTFSSITSDKIFLLSTDTNFTNKAVQFEKLDTYEYTQDDYLEKINPNTYAMVRGEILLEFLESMYDVLLNHTHNINRPYARTTNSAHDTMVELYNKLKSELLNNSIRTN